MAKSLPIAQQVRRALATLHLWLGLTIGALFVVTGLTGSVLVFHQEWDKAVHPALQVSAGGRPASLEAVYQVLLTRGSDKDGWWSIEVPPDGGVINGRYNRPAKDGRPAQRRVVSVDPAKLTVQRDVVWGRYAATFIYDLHQQLLTPPPRGRTLMGIAGAAILGLLALGLALWWPRPGDWKRNLTLSPTASARRRLLELHQMAGVYCGLFLLIIVATGTMIALPDQTKAGLTLISAPQSLAIPASTPGVARIPLDGAARSAQAVYPKARIVWIDAPKDAKGAYQVRMQATSDPSPRFPRTYVWVDQYSGNVLGARTSAGESGADKVLTWLHSIHNGEAFGLPGRILAFLLGLIPLALFVTGLWRWRKAQS